MNVSQMKNVELITKLHSIVRDFKTVYMWGVFGALVTESIIAEKAKQYPTQYSVAKQAELRKLAGKGYFGFDCVNLIKGILWGWNGDPNKKYGGATYPTAADIAAGACPDIGADAMIAKCIGVSTDFKNIHPGEAVWISGHIGIYIGDGKVIESTSKWNNCVQLTACLNIGSISGVNGRKWTKHGKLPYIAYVDEPVS